MRARDEIKDKGEEGISSGPRECHSWSTVGEARACGGPRYSLSIVVLLCAMLLQGHDHNSRP